MKPKIGFIGLGVIGLPMAERLLEQGLPLMVWNRTADKARALEARGAGRAATPRELAERSDVVVTMVTDGPALEEVAFRADGVAAGLAAGKVHCDMSTIDPATSRRMAERYARSGAPDSRAPDSGAQFVQAPVLGNWRAAAAGELLIFAGGPAPAVEKCEPVFAALGRRTWRWQEPEKAACVKLACNLLLGGMMELLAESLAFGGRAGIDATSLLDIIGDSALAAPMFRTKGETMARRDFTPSFYLRNMLKDLRLAAEAGAQFGLALPASQAIGDVYAEAAKTELAEADYSAVLEWLERRRARIGRAGHSVAP